MQGFFAEQSKQRENITRLFNESRVSGLSISLLAGAPSALADNLYLGYRDKEKKLKVTENTRFQMASLSKSVAAAFAVSYFASKNISLDTKINQLLKEAGSPYLLLTDKELEKSLALKVSIRHLLNHSALGMHYVRGHPLGQCPESLSLLKDLTLKKEPGKTFHYSGGGFILLQYLLETLEKKPLHKIMAPFLKKSGLADFHATPQKDAEYALGYRDDGRPIEGGRLSFPPLAAGFESTTKSFALFLCHLINAYQAPQGQSPLEACIPKEMFTNPKDQGAMDFIGAKVGLGVFIAEAGPHKIALHQAANDGFRGLYMACIFGPKKGEGFVIASNGDENAAMLNCLIARELLAHWQGVASFGEAAFDYTHLKQEEIVNLSLKKMVLDYFS